MASFIGDFLFSREAKCNREVGSQIENLRVVIAITDQRFILLDSTNRRQKLHKKQRQKKIENHEKLKCEHVDKEELLFYLPRPL